MPKATPSQQPLRRSARTKNEKLNTYRRFKKTPAVELSEILESGSVSQPIADSSTSRLGSRPMKIPTKSSTTRKSRREKNLNKSDALPSEEEPEVVPHAEEHGDVLDAPASPTRSLSIPYTYATPDSSQASPIRDADLISQPLRPELVEVYQHIITVMNITSEGDKADLAAVITLEAAAAKLREKAEELRAIARAERGQRERLENFNHIIGQ
ncbi:hypothetical protein H0H93_007464 [Arthromyces matolae]|nr:hypothetical protein H0H93_007464 [Arthromyces matolae]